METMTLLMSQCDHSIDFITYWFLEDHVMNIEYIPDEFILGFYWSNFQAIGSSFWNKVNWKQQMKLFKRALDLSTGQINTWIGFLHSIKFMWNLKNAKFSNENGDGVE